MSDLSLYTLPNDTGVCLLDCCTAFKNLTDTEQKYAHYIAQASFYGGLIVLVQVSFKLVSHWHVNFLRLFCEFCRGISHDICASVARVS